jgi:hypothetical protein
MKTLTIDIDLLNSQLEEIERQNLSGTNDLLLGIEELLSRLHWELSRNKSVTLTIEN